LLTSYLLSSPTTFLILHHQFFIMMLQSGYKALFGAILASAVVAVPTTQGSSSPNAKIMSRDFVSTTDPVPHLDPKEVAGIVAEMKSANGVLGQFHSLLEKDGQLLEGDELRQRIVFDFGENQRK
jgi:hypothetical protein